ncbi:glycoside hydrolase family 5 protein [Acetivibrio cellulolyticus]|uniref:glycoside hydrolase family 5 protein n=1 Tax=Acetivibrio cellulolyticus TaxID=35830 RepID=UPI0001E2F66F|nr:cellulase family glycosylhydrolase [Acetivibrio cellulolyticus]
MTDRTTSRWKGFNLLNLFISKKEADMNGKYERHLGDFSEEYIKWIADWGFNCIRIPMCYRNWVGDEKDFYKMDEVVLEKIDRVIEMGSRNGLHVSLNIHRAPGYCINTEIQEPFDLWKDREAQQLFCFYWETFSKRYKGISGDKLSFDLLNEPPCPEQGKMTEADYVRIMREAINTIREVDNNRKIVVEGLCGGNEPVFELVDTGAIQSCRAYIPFGLSHYMAEWVSDQKWETPVWPGAKQDERPWDRKMLEDHYEKWVKLTRKGIPVICGEGGAYIHTPHEVMLKWMEDVLDILKSNNIGFLLWEFSGEFGIMDSKRRDVTYEDWHGHALDRKMLELMRKY